MKELKIINQQEVLGKDFKVYGDFENLIRVSEKIESKSTSVPVGEAFGWTEGSAVTPIVGTASEYTESEGAE